MKMSLCQHYFTSRGFPSVLTWFPKALFENPWGTHFRKFELKFDVHSMLDKRQNHPVNVYNTLEAIQMMLVQGKHVFSINF